MQLCTKGSRSKTCDGKLRSQPDCEVNWFKDTSEMAFTTKTLGWLLEFSLFLLHFVWWKLQNEFLMLFRLKCFPLWKWSLFLTCWAAPTMWAHQRTVILNCVCVGKQMICHVSLGHSTSNPHTVTIHSSPEASPWPHPLWLGHQSPFFFFLLLCWWHSVLCQSHSCNSTRIIIVVILVTAHHLSGGD